MAACSISNCPNYREKAVLQGKCLYLSSFHRFPKEQVLLEKWLQVCCLNEPVTKNSYVCSRHFLDGDFEKELKSELLYLPKKRKLLPTAVPSLFLKIEPKWEEEIELEEPKIQFLHSLSNDNENIQPEDVYSKITTLERQNEELLALRKQLLERIFRLETELAQKNAVIDDLKKANVYFESNSYLGKLGIVLSDSQIKVLTRVKDKVCWSNEDIIKSLSIRYFNSSSDPKSALKYPLPGIAMLQSWVSNINLANGVLSSFLCIMEIYGQALKDLERATVLQLGELKVRPLYEYDNINDEVVGPFSSMQVIMARGLFSPWKQLVYATFDQKITKDALLSLIGSLHKIKYNVVCCVSNCEEKNFEFWKKLDLDVSRSYIAHPVTNDNVYFFADAPHLLKLARNQLLDTGFILNVVEKINADPIKSLLDKGPEINVLHMLTPEHLQREGNDRHNVTQAAQLLSQDTAAALLHCPTGAERKSVINLVVFLENMSQWFDLMNLDLSAPHIASITDRNKILQAVSNLITSLSVTKSQTFHIFKKGILMSIASFQSLSSDMHKRYVVSNIHTRKLNMDTIENFFSELQCHGYDKDLTPLTALYYMKMIMVGKNPSTVNSSQEKGEIFILKDVLSKSNVLKNFDILRHMEKQNYDTLSIISDPSVFYSKEMRIKYLAGWVAGKFVEKYPDMCRPYQIEIEHNYASLTWIQHDSFANTTYPSETWLSKARCLENTFQNVYKSKASEGRNLVKRLTKCATMRVPTLPEEVIQTYMVQRLLIAIEDFNKNSQGGVESIEKRKNQVLSVICDRTFKKIKIGDAVVSF